MVHIHIYIYICVEIIDIPGWAHAGIICAVLSHMLCVSYFIYVMLIPSRLNNIQTGLIAYMFSVCVFPTSMVSGVVFCLVAPPPPPPPPPPYPSTPYPSSSSPSSLCAASYYSSSSDYSKHYSY